MTVELTVLGGENLDAKAGQLVREAARLQRRISSAAGRAVSRTFEPALVAATPEFMPAGYARALGPDLKVKTQVRFAGSRPGVRARVSAPTGGPKGREVSAVEAGRLKHPLFGNKSHWYTNRIKRGFASSTLRKTQPQIVKELDDELAAVRKDLEKK